MCRIEWLSGNDFFDKRDGADYPQDKANIRKYRLCIALLRRKIQDSVKSSDILDNEFPSTEYWLSPPFDPVSTLLISHPIVLQPT